LSASRATSWSHAYNDHISAAEYRHAAYDVPVLMHQEEVPHTRRDFLNQVSVGQVLAQAWRPGMLPWAVHALRAGGITHVPVCEPQAPRVTAPSTCPAATS